ncbi:MULTISPECIES: DUF805 domain-containing protein [unclassified Bradyrhizobium]|uniref:DUF805 domain-containing protein n=1 Tax=unclassified Bradyrhizobium TaxID=2631580 RepID=UPI002916DA75|nr:MULTISPECIES: DUF805 domain-containing protein [unclassified Bradyrhizobium]
MRLLSFLFSFEGRISRRSYWLYFVLPVFVIFLGVAIAAPPLSFNRALLTLFLLVIWPALAVGAKRCHDRNRSGWHQLIGLIPVIGPFVLLIELGILQGTEGPNRFDFRQPSPDGRPDSVA